MNRYRLIKKRNKNEVSGEWHLMHSSGKMQHNEEENTKSLKKSMCKWAPIKTPYVLYHLLLTIA